MKQYQIIEAPSNLGLKPTGVELLPAALRVAGFLPDCFSETLPVPVHHLVYSPVRDPQTKLLNGEAVAQFAQTLAQTVKPLVQAGTFPIVLGGDCSVLLGPMVALRQLGRYGLLFVDAHADFYQPEAELNGEIASMDLAVVSGRGPDIIANINGLRPYVLDEDIVHVGQRDQAEAQENNSQRIQETAITCFDLNQIRQRGMAEVAEKALEQLSNAQITGFWTHLDVDVLADDCMPAVDYRLPGGLTFEEWTYLINEVIRHPLAIGVTITIFNPKFDKDGQVTKQLVHYLNEAFQHQT